MRYAQARPARAEPSVPSAALPPLPQSGIAAVRNSRGRQDDESPGLIGADLDALVNWFCLMFGRQFTAEEVYEYYPADRLITDIALCVLAVQQRVSGALKAFPTIPAADRKTEA